MSAGQRPIEALARGLRILEVLSRSTGTMGNGQISRATGLPASTVSRLTDSLVQLGYLRIDPSSGAYSLTPKNLRLGYPLLANLPFGGRVYKALDRLTESTGMTSALATDDDLHMAYVAVARARHHDGVTLAVGGRLPISVSAAGIAFVRALPEPKRSRLIAAVTRDLQQRGQSVEAFEQRLNAPPSRHVVSTGAWHEDIGGVATVVRAGGELFALTLVVNLGEFDESRIEEEVLPHLWAAADAISD